MIRLVGRKLLFGTDEQYLGTTYDADTGKRTFIRDRRSSDSADLAALNFYVLMNYKDGTVDMQDLEKSVTDNDITLIWNLSQTIFNHEGYCSIWVRAVDEQKVTRWSSEKAVVYITAAGSGDFSPSAADSATLEAIIKAEKERVTAETARATAETERATAETKRATAETERATAETARAEAETNRQSAEVLRTAAESDRSDAENLRAEEELKRINNEDTRVANEKARVEAETARANAETGRAKAETTRTENETKREAAYTDFITAKETLENFATTSKSWAVGGTGSRDGEDTDNSKYYSEQAASSNTSAKSYAESAKANAETVQSLTTLVIPEFTMDNNRVYMTEDGTDRFLLDSNRIYVKRIEVA